MRHDYPTRVPPGGFARLAAEGATADRLIPPFPSQTFSGHATLATGVSAQRHGILNNRFKDRVKGVFSYRDEARWYDAMPVWIHTTRLGLRTHVLQWVGSRGPWQGTEPALAPPFDKSMDDDDKLDTVLAWLAGPQPPRLVMSYWYGCDKAGHGEGPESSEVTDCIAETDARLERLRAGLAALPIPVTLLVVSDHGMARTLGTVNLYRAFEVLDFAVEIIPSGPIAHVFVAPERLAATEALARSLLHVTTWRRDTVPLAFAYRHPTRTGDLVLMAEPGWTFDGRNAEPLPGVHGHDPTSPDMGAIFFAWGDGIRPGSRVTQPRAVDIVPTICHLLHLPVPAGVEGRALEEILAAPGDDP